MTIIGYIHICAINNYRHILQEQIAALKKSKLFDATDHINVAILSPNNEFIPELDDPKFRIRYQSSDTNLFERPILNIMRSDCIQDYHNSTVNYVWYIHSKGVSSKNQKTANSNNVRNWRKSMEAVVIWNWEACVKKLSQENYDTCGVNYTDRITKKYHYSGNFWWSQSTYIAGLPELPFIHHQNFNQYVEPEMWIGLNNPRAFSFYNSIPNYVIPNLPRLGLKPVPT